MFEIWGSLIVIISTVKLPNATQRLVSQENVFEKSKNPSAFLCNNMGANIFFSFELKKKIIFFLKKATFQFKVRVHYGLKKNPDVAPYSINIIDSVMVFLLHIINSL